MNQGMKNFWRVVCVTGAIAGALLAVALFCGCRSSGVRIVASSSTYTNLAEINYDECKWPVFSFISGPKVTVWVNRDFRDIKSVRAYGTVTNTTSAFAIYNTSDNKATHLEVDFTEKSTTNEVAGATD